MGVGLGQSRKVLEGYWRSLGEFFGDCLDEFVLQGCQGIGFNSWGRCRVIALGNHWGHRAISLEDLGQCLVDFLSDHFGNRVKPLGGLGQFLRPLLENCCGKSCTFLGGSWPIPGCILGRLSKEILMEIVQDSLGYLSFLDAFLRDCLGESLGRSCKVLWGGGGGAKVSRSAWATASGNPWRR